MGYFLVDTRINYTKVDQEYAPNTCIHGAIFLNLTKSAPTTTVPTHTKVRVVGNNITCVLVHLNFLTVTTTSTASRDFLEIEVCLLLELVERHK